MINRIAVFAAMAVLLAAANASAVTVVPVLNNGTLTGSTSTTTTENDLTLNSGTAGFNFSGSTGSFAIPAAGGSFSSPSGASAKGDYYADFLITITGSAAESVTTSLTNGFGTAGVNNLSERIYGYNASSGVNGFLGDGSPGAGIPQIWSANYPLPGVNVSIVGPASLSAGTYVIELRGTNAGSFGGTLSITPVPEPETYGMLLAGLILVGFAVSRRKNASGDKFLAA